jgi:hypothetical protein
LVTTASHSTSALTQGTLASQQRQVMLMLQLPGAPQAPLRQT